MPGSVASVERAEDLEHALAELGLVQGRPTLVLVGGAAGIDEADVVRLAPVFDELVLAAEREGATVVDGGTDVGVMRLLGRARADRGATFPLVGVLPEELAATSGSDGAGTPLEPNHTHFVLVPGERWGDEVPWLARVADVLANGRPSVTVLVNGGDVARRDVAESVRAARPVVVVGGTGRAADELATALAGGTHDERLGELRTSGLVEVTELGDDGGESVGARVGELLAGGR
jgi:predicted Rossmann-fold nucleotide-binding protein